MHRADPMLVRRAEAARRGPELPEDLAEEIAEVWTEIEQLAAPSLVDSQRRAATATTPE